MKCVICKNGETQPGKATVTFERDQRVIVIQAVPAEVCENCGEEYVDDIVTEKLLLQAESMFSAGVKFDVRNYVAA